METENQDFFDPGAAQAGEPVRIHIYASRSNIVGPVYAHMESIRANVARRNGALGVNTALLHQSGWFVQWLEGPTDAVRQIVARVAADPRHGAMHVLHDDVAPRQLHEPWSMAVVHCAEGPADFAQRVARLGAEHTQGVRHTATALWRLLSTPHDHAGAAAHDDPALFCRTLVCAADVDESFELVRWLAREYRVDVVRRRFAGNDTPDVETDYVDFIEGGGVCQAPPRVHRVIAMARNGIHIGLTRAFMADYGSLVLLRGTDARRDGRLLEAMAQACALLPRRPTLVSVGADMARQGALRRIACERGMVYEDVAVTDPRDPADVWRSVAPVVSRHAVLPATPQACRARR
jgi:hypothetical protein